MEPIKYKPQKHVVKKVKDAFDKIKAEKVIKCHLFKAKFILILLIFSSCSAEYHIKKAISKNPSILIEQTIEVDTLIITDSFAFTDTFTIKTVDTLVIENERFKTVLIRSHDTMILSTIVKPDTVRFTKTITLPPTVEYIKKKIPIWVYVLLAIFGVGFIYKMFK